MGQYTVLATDNDPASRFNVQGALNVSVVDDNGTTAIRFADGNGSADGSGLARLIDAGYSVGDFDIVCLMRRNTTSGSTAWPGALAARADRSSLLDGYMFGDENSVNTLYNRRSLRSYTDGNFTNLAVVEYRSVNLDDYAWRRFQGSGTTLKCKLWTGARSDEPAGWDIDLTNSDWSTGAVGVFVRERSVNPTKVYVQELYVGTEGDAPPDPSGGGTTVTIGQALEASTAFALTSSKNQAVAQAQETSTAFALTVEKLLTAGLATSTETARVIASSKNQSVAQAQETDAAFAVNVVTPGEQVVTIGQAAETDTAFAVAAATAQAIGQSSETDTAHALAAGRAIGVDQPAETDTAFGVDWSKAFRIGVAGETDVALRVTVSGGEPQVEGSYPVLYRRRRRYH